MRKILGIVSALLNYKSLTHDTKEYGRAFEQFDSGGK